MLDHSTSSIITKCGNIESNGFLPIYEAYFSLLQDDDVRIVYLSTTPNRSFVRLTSKIFTSTDYEMIVCSPEEYKSTDPRVYHHLLELEAVTSSLLNRINGYGDIDVVVMDLDLSYAEQVTVFNTMYRYLTKGGLLMVLNTNKSEDKNKLLAHCKMLKKPVMSIDYIRVYNDEQFVVIKKR